MWRQRARFGVIWKLPAVACVVLVVGGGLCLKLQAWTANRTKLRRGEKLWQREDETEGDLLDARDLDEEKTRRQEREFQSTFHDSMYSDVAESPSELVKEDHDRTTTMDPYDQWMLEGDTDDDDATRNQQETTPPAPASAAPRAVAFDEGGDGDGDGDGDGGGDGDDDDAVTTTSHPEKPGFTFFCISLIVPWSSEPALVGAQADNHVGVFACDAFAVYTDQVMNLGTQGKVKTKPVHVDLHSQFGGQYHTAMNTPIFRAFWAQVLADGEWRNHDWTIKVDADTMFLPSHLKHILSRLPDIHEHATTANGTFINNCYQGLHGPIEVISNRALQVYNSSWHRCAPNPPQEDLYMEACFKTLGVLELNAFNVLAEKACMTQNWYKCDAPFGAFHPFKEIGPWITCHQRALDASLN